MTEDTAVAHFWEVARVAGKVSRLEVFMGRAPLDTVPPPAWSFGADQLEADRLLAAVLEGRKTAATSPYREYEGTEENLPHVGDLSIVLDGAGQPRALIRTTAVAVVPFADVDPEHARADGVETIDEWSELHERVFTARAGQNGRVFTTDDPVVLERFALVYPKARRVRTAVPEPA
ncbi:MAG: ASCH domain-containing protein [Actinomycetales bacterium]|nr:ASCH domain-containing protein [Actinomycetales bacterium]